MRRMRRLAGSANGSAVAIGEATGVCAVAESTGADARQMMVSAASRERSVRFIVALHFYDVGAKWARVRVPPSIGTVRRILKHRDTKERTPPDAGRPIW